MTNLAVAERLQTILAAAQSAAKAAGALQLASLGSKTLSIETKSTGIDLVTQVDLACDKAICEILKTATPDALLITEETFKEGTEIDLSHTWVVDPLDGTTNYAHSFPHFAVSIAYFQDGQPTVAVVYDPTRDDCFSAIKGHGAFLNKKTVETSSTQQLATALLATGFPYNLAETSANNLDYFQKVLPKCHGVRRPGAAALDLAYVACGRLDAFWELSLSPWDIAAGALLVTEAGGICADLTGQPLNYAKRRIDITAANNNALLTQLTETLAS